MKNNLRFAAIVLGLGALTVSCEKNEIATSQDEKSYTVTFSCTGEVTDVTVSPLTKALASDDIIGIQAYSSIDGGATYQPYAFGLFDDISKASVTLVGGRKYKFASLAVINGKSLITCVFDGYFPPFAIYNGGDVFYPKVNTPFRVDSSPVDFETGHLYPYSIWGHSTKYGRPCAESYYGISAEVEPNDNDVVTLEMKAIFCGLKLVINWDESIMEGSSIRVALSDAPGFSINYPTTVYESPYGFNTQPKNVYADDAFKQNADLTLTLVRPDGTELPIVTNKSIPFERKKLTTVNVTVGELSSTGQFAVVLEDGTLEEGSTINI